MRLGDVDDEEADLVRILIVELVEGGNLPPKGRSGVAAEDENDGLMLRGERRKLYVR
jgi:hypothetical protein